LISARKTTQDCDDLHLCDFLDSEVCKAVKLSADIGHQLAQHIYNEKWIQLTKDSDSQSSSSSSSTKEDELELVVRSFFSLFYQPVKSDSDSSIEDMHQLIGTSGGEHHQGGELLKLTCFESRQQLLTSIMKRYGYMRIFYCDPGRFVNGLREALKPMGWVQLLNCCKARSNNRSLPLKSYFGTFVEFVWVKNRGSFPYERVHDGGVITSHIPTEWELTKKDRLADNTQRYARYLHRTGKFGEFAKLTMPVHPETFRLKIWNDCEAFINVVKAHEESSAATSSVAASSSSAPSPQNTNSVNGQLFWIVKPTKGAGGKGITIHADSQKFISDYERVKADLPKYKTHLRERSKQTRHDSAPRDDPTRFLLTGQIAQRYIARPLLIDGRKFDIRVYLYIADVQDELVFYNEGYARLNAVKYDSDFSDLSNRYAHLSNVSIQKKHPDFKSFSNDMRWKFSRLQAALTERNLAPSDYISTTLKETMKLQLWYAFKSASHRLTKGTGQFSLVGADFMIDENLHVWLIEFSKSPAVYRSPSGIFWNRFGEMIAETCAMQCEIFDKKNAGHSFKDKSKFHLDSMLTYELCTPIHASAPKYPIRKGKS